MVKNGLSSQTSRIFLAILIGAIQGTSYYLLKLSSLPHWLINSLSAFTIATGFLLIMGLPIVHWRRWLLSSFIGGALIASLFSYWFLNITLFNNLFYFNALNLLASYVITVYVLSLQEEKLTQIDYHLLFKHTWNALFSAFIATVFVALIGLLISFWGYLFELINFVQVKNILSSEIFKVVATFIVVAFSLTVSKQYFSTILRLRKLFFNFCYICLPVLGMITLSFLLALLLNPGAWEFSAGFVFIFIFLSMVMMNGVIQEGNRESAYSFWVQHIIEAYFLVLPVIPFLMMMTLSFKMGVFGLRPWLIIKFTFAFLMAICLVGYAFVIFLRSRGWMWAVPKINVIVSLVVVFIAVGMQLPFFNPIKLSISDQASRLLNGRYVPTDNEPTFLPGINLSALNLHGIYFYKAHLQRAKFIETNLSTANLSFADLQKANLTKANLSGTNLVGAKLKGADLTGANLSEALVSGVNFAEVKGISQQQLNQIGCSRFVIVPEGMHIKNCRTSF